MADQPWWVAAVMDYWRDLTNEDVRVGVRVYRTLAVAERGHPGPPPPPRAGQVWASEAYGTWTITAVAPDGAHHVRVVYDPAANEAVVVDETVWPPPGAVLVWGPGAPWGPATIGGDRG